MTEDKDNCRRFVASTYGPYRLQEEGSTREEYSFVIEGIEAIRSAPLSKNLFGFALSGLRSDP